jgi:NTP-dependent ternary system trypsin peptidase co-occuring protein
VPSYLAFDAPEGGSLLIEVEPEDVAAAGVIKAGIRQRLEDSLAEAEATLDAALTRLLRSHAQIFLRALEGVEPGPAQAELAFGLKATAEAGNFAVAKVASEANYNIKLVWSRP